MRRESIKVGGRIFRGHFGKERGEERRERVDWLTPLHYGEIFVTVTGQALIMELSKVFGRGLKVGMRHNY